MTDLLITNTRPMGGTPADILIREGRITAIGPNLVADGAEIEDAGGRIAIPISTSRCSVIPGT
jgi:dihydroorotase-like cyclic amidohydrolase